MTAVPASRPADCYGGAIEARPPLDPLGRRLKAELDRWASGKGLAALTEDERLDRVASDMACAMSGGKSPAPELLTFLASYYGLVEPEPSVVLISGEAGAEAAIIDQLGRKLADAPASERSIQVGIGVCRAGEAFQAVIALQEHVLALSPIPRTLPRGGRAGIAGRVAAGLHDPTVLLTGPAGAVSRLPTRVAGNAFWAELECSGDGAYQVEIMAEDRRGPSVVANFPVYCGRPPPRSLRLTTSPAPASPASPAAIEQQILVLLNRDRAVSGVPPLVSDVRLAEVARRYSQEMASRREVAHLSQSSGSAVDRIRAAGITPAPTVVAENVGQDYSAEGSEQGFMTSPGHRANILSSAVTHVGIGVALGAHPDGDMTPIFVTQLFAGWSR